MNENRFGLKKTKLTSVLGEFVRICVKDFESLTFVCVLVIFDIDIRFHYLFEGLFLFHFLPPMNYMPTIAFTSLKISIPVCNVFPYVSVYVCVETIDYAVG